MPPVSYTHLTAKLADPVFYQGDASVLAATKARFAACEREHAEAFTRWEKLEASRAGS